MSNENPLNSKKCLVIIGRAGAGKDTVANMIYDNHYETRPFALRFSEPLKKVCETVFGWNALALGEADYKAERLPHALYRADESLIWTRREALQYLGTDVFRTMDPNVWVTAALRHAKTVASRHDCAGFISTDCRFPNEFDALYENFAEVYVVRIVKVGGFQLETAHASEAYVDDMAADKGFAVEAGDFATLRAIATQLTEFFK